MRVKNLTLAELEEKVIAIGFVDENLYTQVRIDCKELFDEHPDAIPSLAVQPPQGDAYPAVVTRDGDIVVWNVAKSDVQYANLGRLQLTFTIGEIVAKSYVGKYVIDKSIMPDGEAPTPIENWITEANAILGEIPGTITEAVDNALEEAKESGEFDGADGVSPMVNVTKTQDGHHVVITDAEGDHPFDVQDGTEGKDGVTPEFSIGTVSEGHIADVTMTGTKENPVLNFVMPKVTTEDIVAVQDTEPTSEETAIWFPETPPTPVQIPTYAELMELKEDMDSKADASDVTELGEKVDRKADEPTGTKSTGKVYGLDINLNPAWVEKDTDPSVIAEATAEWLDDHPEATTTVEDGSITKNKLSSVLANEIESKAPGITADTSKAFNHSGVTAPSKITFYGNANAFGNAKYANRKNVSPGNTKTQTKSDVVCTGTGCFINLNGTASGNNSFEHMDKALDAELPAGDYKVYVLIAPGESTISSYGTFDFYIRYSDEATNKNRVSRAIDGTENVYTFTASKAFNRIRYTFPITSGNVYNNAKVWIGLFKSDVSIVDCGQTVASDGTLAYNVTTSIGTNEVSTMLHESVLTDVIDTKTYIDNHIPENMITEDDLIYLTPEMYGAVGDGVTDDSSAFQDCLDAASLAGVPVRANGKYAIGTGLIITHGNTVDFTDVFFNSITFTGSGSAITMKGYCNRVTGNILSGYSNSNATSMLKLEGVTNSTNGNNIDISVIFAYNDAVELDCTNGSINYNVFNSRNIVSRNGNCFYLHGAESASIGENTFYCKMITCNNGYAVYVANNGSYTNRFYNMRCEHQCANIVYGIASIVDARTVECMDQKESNLAKGNVFTIPSGQVGHMANSVGTFIDLEAFNVENADSYEDRIALLVSSYEGGLTKAQAFNKAFYQCGNSFGSYVVGRCNRYICDDVASIIEQGIYYILSPGKLISYYNKKGFVPDENIVRTVDSATYYPCKRAFPTDMVMGANSTIYLDDSYCCLGISKFTITQTESYKAVVYDKNNNKIFEGTNIQPGVYQFTCRFVPLTSLTVTLSNETTLTYTGLEVAHLYTGSNEEWVIEKLNVIS